MKNIRLKKTNWVYIYASIILVTILLIPTSCQKFLEPTPYGQVSMDVAFNSFSGGAVFTSDLYQRLSRQGYYRSGLIKIDELSDDIGSQGSNQDRSFYFFEFASDHPTINGIWGTSYGIIQQANLIIERVPLSPIYAPGQQFNSSGNAYKNQFVGEALVFRAFAYFNLVRLFGAVPLHLQPISSPENANKPVSSVEQIYNQIEQDLKQAIPKLPKFYSQGLGNERGRASVWTAKLILAYVSLTRRNFVQARDMSKAVIDSGLVTKGVPYSLLPAYSDLFYAKNTGIDLTDESIFEAQFWTPLTSGDAQSGNSFANWMGPSDDGTPNPNLAQFIPSDNNSPLNLTSDFTGGIVQAYSRTSEPRFKTNFTFWPLRGVFLTSKYYEPRKPGVGLGNVPIYRLADAYLVYAESENELMGNQTEIYNHVNAIRRRANTEPFNVENLVYDLPAGLSQSSLRDSIRIERRREFPAEGKRWFDLLRYDAANPGYIKILLVDKQKRASYNDSKKLFPIPFGETSANPFVR